MSNRREFLVEGGKLAVAGLAATAGLGLPDQTSKNATAERHRVGKGFTYQANPEHRRPAHVNCRCVVDANLPESRLVFHAEICAGDSLLRFWGYQCPDHGRISFGVSCDRVPMRRLWTIHGNRFVTCALRRPIIVHLRGVDSSTFRSPIVTIEAIKIYDRSRPDDPGGRFPRLFVDLPVTSITLHEGSLRFRCPEHWSSVFGYDTSNVWDCFPPKTKGWDRIVARDCTGDVDTTTFTRKRV